MKIVKRGYSREAGHLLNWLVYTIFIVLDTSKEHVEGFSVSYISVDAENKPRSRFLPTLIRTNTPVSTTCNSTPIAGLYPCGTGDASPQSPSNTIQRWPIRGSDLCLECLS